MPKWLKYVIVGAFYVVAIILCLGGVTAVAGVPLGLVGVTLQKNFGLK